MTNRSIELLMKMMNGKEKKIEIARKIVGVEYDKIVAQAKNFNKMCNTEKLANDILNFKDSDELFDYLNDLSIVEISLLSSYGIDVAFMNLLKVSDY